MIEQLHIAEHSALAASGAALIIGATGGIGNALLTQLQSSQRFAAVLGCARSDYIKLDLLDESKSRRTPTIYGSSSMPQELCTAKAAR